MQAPKRLEFLVETAAGMKENNPDDPDYPGNKGDPARTRERESDPPPGPWNPASLLATWFGAGLLPGMPGTWGSLAALPFAWFLRGTFGWQGLAVFAAGVFLVGLWSTTAYVRRRGDGDADPGAVVIDEVVGQCLTLLLVPLDVVLYGAGFFLFRLTDVLKPWPVSWADRHVGGALGVMLDDVLAAVYAGGILYGLMWWMEIS